MNWDELTAIWRGQPRERLPDAQFEALGRTFEKKSRRLARALFWRDIREMLAAVLAILVFGRAAVQRGYAGWPIWIAILVLLWIAVGFLRERLRARRQKTGPEASLLEKVDADLREWRHQRELVLKVGAWGLWPLFLSWFLVLASTRFHGLGGFLRTPIQMGGYFAGGVALFWLIARLNRRAVHKCIEPRIADLEKLRNSLISANLP